MLPDPFDDETPSRPVHREEEEPRHKQRATGGSRILPDPFEQQDEPERAKRA